MYRVSVFTHLHMYSTAHTWNASKLYGSAIGVLEPTHYYHERLAPAIAKLCRWKEAAWVNGSTLPELSLLAAFFASHTK